MFAEVALLLSLALAPTTAEPPLKLAMPGLRMVDLDANRGSFYSEHLALQMKRAGIDVLTEREIGALLGMERQKQLLGCGDEATSCIAEMANAMGTEGVVLGDVAKIGQGYQVNLKVVSARDGKTLAIFSERVESEEGAVDALTRGAEQLAGDVRVAFGLQPMRAEATAGPARRSRFWWAPVIAGAAGIAIGAGLFLEANNRTAPIRNATASDPLLISEARTLGGQASALQTGGAVSLGIGLALVAAGAAIAVLHFTRDAQVSFMFGPTGGAVALTGSWP